MKHFKGKFTAIAVVVVQWKKAVYINPEARQEKEQQLPTYLASKRNDRHLWGSKDLKSLWKIECIVVFCFYSNLQLSAPVTFTV